MTKQLPIGTPIIQLLLDCLHQDPERVTAGRVTCLTDGDWDELVSLSQEQRVAPLLYDRLKSIDLSSVSAGKALTVLRNRYRQNAFRNLRLFSDLKKIAEVLKAENIPVIALKGAHLAQSVYGNIALREMNDIDLLVPPDQLEQAGNRLIEEGYRPYQPYDAELALLTLHHLPRFTKPRTTSVELHWNLTYPDCAYTIDPEPLWNRAVPFETAGFKLSGLASDDLLLHLCLHTSYQHQFQFGLRPFCDIAALIRYCGQSLNWETVQLRANSWGWRKGVYLALRLARGLTGADVPEKLLAELTPAGFDETVIQTALRQLFTEKAFAHRMTHEAAKAFNRPTLRGKINAMAARVFLPRNTIAQTFSIPPASWRVFLYYPVRFWDLIFRYRHIIRELGQGNPETAGLTRRKRFIAEWLEEV